MERELDDGHGQVVLWSILLLTFARNSLQISFQMDVAWCWWAHHLEVIQVDKLFLVAVQQLRRWTWCLFRKWSSIKFTGVQSYILDKFLTKWLLDAQNPDRDFVLKVSALEIYNEVVKDLLTSDSTPLRLLDDKEVSSKVLQCFMYWLITLGAFSFVGFKFFELQERWWVLRYFLLQRGTIVEKLKEEVVRDVGHLRQVIKICEGILLNH